MMLADEFRILTAVYTYYSLGYLYQINILCSVSTFTNVKLWGCVVGTVFTWTGGNGVQFLSPCRPLAYMFWFLAHAEFILRFCLCQVVKFFLKLRLIGWCQP